MLVTLYIMFCNDFGLLKDGRFGVDDVGGFSVRGER